MLRTLLSILLLTSAATASDPKPMIELKEPIGGMREGVKILGPALAAEQKVDAANPVIVTPGRFFAFTPLDGSPSYIAPNDSFRIYTVAKGGTYIGVKFDAPADAEPETYSWPNEKGPVYVLLARNRVGTHAVQLVKNGPTETGPVANGPAILVQIGVAPQPPPTPPKPPTPPEPQPPVVAGKLWGYVLVEETAVALATRGEVLRSVNTYCKANGLKWREVDQNAVDAFKKAPSDVAGYIADAQKLGVPRVYFIDINGNSLWEGKPGGTPKEWIDKLEQLRGK